MAHIPDGVLSTPVVAVGSALTAGLLAYSTSKLSNEKVPQTAVLSAAFFVASLINIPIGAGSIHLMLTGLMGVILGSAVVPAIFIGLLLQAVFFGFGGILVLGVNTLNIALPAVLGGLLYQRLLSAFPKADLRVMAAGITVLVLALTALMVSVSLMLSRNEFIALGQFIPLTYIPLMIVEAVITFVILGFVLKVAPEILDKNL